VIFVIDESTSLNRHESDVTGFLYDVVRKLPVSNDGTHVSVGLFSTQSREIFDLDEHTDKTSLLRAINNIDLQGGGGEINAGLSYAVNDAMTKAAGDRPEAPNVVIVMTDDGTRSSSTLRSLEDQLQQMSDNVIAVEIGHVTFNHLSTDSRHEFHLRDTHSLDSIINSVSGLICPSGSFP